MAINKVLITPDPIQKQYVAALTTVQSPVIDVSGAQSLTFSIICSSQDTPDTDYHRSRLCVYGSQNVTGNNWNVLLDIALGNVINGPAGTTGANSGSSVITVTSAAYSSPMDSYIIGDGISSFEIVRFVNIDTVQHQVTLLDPLKNSYSNGSTFYGAFTEVRRVGIYGLTRIKFSFMAGQSNKSAPTAVNLSACLGVADSGISFL